MVVLTNQEIDHYGFEAAHIQPMQKRFQVIRNAKLKAEADSDDELPEPEQVPVPDYSCFMS